MLPSQGYVSISRRPPDLEDYIDIVRRHRAWLIGPLLAGFVIAVVTAYVWPDTFISQAVLRITPPQIPENLVPSNFNIQMAERISQMQQEILSRESLAELIQRPGLDLYKKERSRKPMADVVEDMRKNIQIKVVDQQSHGVRPATMFKIPVKSPDRHKAKAVVDQLVSKFTERSVKVSTTQSNLTTDFLSSELRNTRTELDRLDHALAAFRAANSGRLPEQVPNNIQALNALQAQLSAATEAINRDNQDKLLLETALQGLKNQVNSVAVTTEETGAVSKNERLTQLNRTILETEAKLSGLREIYKDSHPDVRNFIAQLTVLKRERDLLEKQEELSDKSRPKKATSPLALRQIESLKLQVANVEAQLKAKDLDIADRSKQQNEINRSMRIYQSRIETSPQSEQKYAELTRDQQLAKARYEEMNRRQGLSEMASNLEARKGGENLEVLDTATLPDSPAEPNRWLIVGAGLGLGLMLGLFLVALREMKDTSLKNLKDVRAYTNLPVLSSVPLLENAAKVQRERQLSWLAWSTAVLIGAIAISSSMYYYYFVSRT